MHFCSNDAKLTLSSWTPASISASSPSRLSAMPTMVAPAAASARQAAGQGLSILDSRAVASEDGRRLRAPAARDRRAMLSTGRARTSASTSCPCGTAGARGPATPADRTGHRLRPPARRGTGRGATRRDRLDAGGRADTAPEPAEVRQGGDEVRRPQAGRGEEAAGDTGAGRGTGTCAGCGNPYARGAKLGAVNGGWGHASCAKVRREASRIRAGETYRAGRQSD
jgi:hypothetical protein